MHCSEDIFIPKWGLVHVHIPENHMQLARELSLILEQKNLQVSAVVLEDSPHKSFVPKWGSMLVPIAFNLLENVRALNLILERKIRKVNDPFYRE